MPASESPVSQDADPLTQVRARIRRAAQSVGRAPGAVTLVAVSKQQPWERVAPVLAAGQRVFGENRVQEAAARWGERRATTPDFQLRLIGPLQTNKAADAVRLFNVIETVDRPRLVEALARAAEAEGRMPTLYVQVNTGEEPQKAGVAPGDLAPLLAAVQDAFGRPAAGLMCIPPAEEAPGPHFALLAKVAERFGLPELSMGMSGDFETAIRFGATSIRVGSALFGERS